MHCLQYSATPYCVKIYCVMYLVFSVPLLVHPNLLIVIFSSIKFFGIGIGILIPPGPGVRKGAEPR